MVAMWMSLGAEKLHIYEVSDFRGRLTDPDVRQPWFSSFHDRL